MMSKFGDGGHSAVLRTLPLSGSLNKRINNSLTLVQMPCGTSFIRNTLGVIGLCRLKSLKIQIKKLKMEVRAYGKKQDL